MIVDLIGNTTTTTGLTVNCVLDTDPYPSGIKYTTKDVDALPITRHDFHGEWNYTVQPATHAGNHQTLFCRVSLDKDGRQHARRISPPARSLNMRQVMTSAITSLPRRPGPIRIRRTSRRQRRSSSLALRALHLDPGQTVDLIEWTDFVEYLDELRGARRN